MGKRTFLILFSFILVIFLFGLALLPYHFYTVVVSEGINADILKIEGQTDKFLASVPYPFKRQDIDVDISEDWETIHFSNFKIPFPVEHPLYQAIPYISIKGDKTTALGVRLGNSVTSEFFSYLESDKEKFDLKITDQNLFQLPIYKKMIFNVPTSRVWKDVFARDLRLVKESQNNLTQYIKSLLRTPYKELVYNLYILMIRVRLFPKTLKHVYYDKERDLHIAEFIPIDERYISETLYHRIGPIVYKIRIRTLKWKKEAEMARRAFYSYIEFSESNETSHVPLYSKFQNLSFNDKVGQIGFIYFYSAWSHQTENKKFVQEMIRYLEKDSNNSNIVVPLYQYAYKKYGTNFSTIREKLRETDQMRLKRMISEEERNESIAIETEPVVIPEKVDLSDEENAKRLLQEAKDAKENIDENNSEVLIH